MSSISWSGRVVEAAPTSRTVLRAFSNLLEDTVTDPLLITLADALANLVVSIDLSDDDDVDPDVCVPWLEDVAATLNQLSAEDRHRLARIIREVAAGESDTRRQAALLETPDHFGLEDSDDA
ncbi:hypothetical protein [Streptomyces sp. NPDC002580]|uniref:hypothetical protein n=1 Tax=Streptomyces sp. NPDC002580 TaxID=3364653 RepID=UPI0036A6C483